MTNKKIKQTLTNTLLAGTIGLTSQTALSQDINTSMLGRLKPNGVSLEDRKRCIATSVGDNLVLTSLECIINKTPDNSKKSPIQFTSQDISYKAKTNLNHDTNLYYGENVFVPETLFPIFSKINSGKQITSTERTEIFNNHQVLIELSGDTDKNESLGSNYGYFGYGTMDLNSNFSQIKQKDLTFYVSNDKVTMITYVNKDFDDGGTPIQQQCNLFITSNQEIMSDYKLDQYSIGSPIFKDFGKEYGLLPVGVVGLSSNNGNIVSLFDSETVEDISKIREGKTNSSDLKKFRKIKLNSN